MSLLGTNALAYLTEASGTEIERKRFRTLTSRAKKGVAVVAKKIHFFNFLFRKKNEDKSLIFLWFNNIIESSGKQKTSIVSLIVKQGARN